MKKCMKSIIAQNEEIVIGADVSDKAHHLAVSDMRGNILKDKVLRNPSNKDWSEFLAKSLPGCAVTVVYEAGPQGYTLYDQVRMLGQEAIVIAPQKNQSPVKTNARDARSIAHDYLAGRVREVVVPTPGKRAARQIIRTRDALRKEITRTLNRVNGMRRFHGQSGTMQAVHESPGGKINAAYQALETVLECLRGQCERLDKALKEMAKQDDFREDVEKMTRLPGVGVYTAMQVTLNVADIARFSNGDKFASHLGLCPGEWSTGESRRQGRITRRGPGRLRGALVQCSWTRIRCDAKEKAFYDSLKARRGKKKAIVAVARRLAVAIWRALNAADAA